MNSVFSENELKCDFPVRESFREALLSRLLAMDEDGLKRVAEAEEGAGDKKAPRSIKLSESQLDLVAAAQGEEHKRENPLGE